MQGKRYTVRLTNTTPSEMRRRHATAGTLVPVKALALPEWCPRAAAGAADTQVRAQFTADTSSPPRPNEPQNSARVADPQSTQHGTVCPPTKTHNTPTKTARHGECMRIPNQHCPDKISRKSCNVLRI